jgi:hypothetical protein
MNLDVSKHFSEKCSKNHVPALPSAALPQAPGVDKDY